MKRHGDEDNSNCAKAFNMRVVSLSILVLAFFAGCRSGGSATPPTVAVRLPRVVGETARLPQASEGATEGTTRQVAYDSLADESAPNTLPAPQAVRPVEVLPDQTLTLGDLEEMALLSNPSLARSSARIETARGNWVQVGLSPNPIVGYSGQQIGSRGLAEQDGIFVSQELVRGGKLRLNRAVAEQGIYQAEHELAAQQQRVITDVRIAYFQTLVARQQEKLADELYQIASKSLSAAEDLLKKKEAARIEVVQAQVEVENADILKQNAKNRSAASWQGLAAVLGRPDLAPQPLAGDPEAETGERTWNESLQLLVSSSPEIAVQVAQLERARRALERASVEKVPNVIVQGMVNARDNGIGGRSDGAITVGLPLPIWDQNQGRIAAARGEVVAAERALEQLELSLQNRLAPVFERYRNARFQIQKYRTKILPAAQETLELTRQLYTAGEANYVSLLTVQRTYFQTKVNYLEAVRELRAAEAQIDGLLLSNSLENR